MRKATQTPQVDKPVKAEQPDDTYFRYWARFLGYDFKNIETGRVYTKGEFYRLHTNLAISLANKAVQLPNPFVLIVKSKS